MWVSPERRDDEPGGGGYGCDGHDTSGHPLRRADAGRSWKADDAVLATVWAAQFWRPRLVSAYRAGAVQHPLLIEG